MKKTSKLPAAPRKRRKPDSKAATRKTRVDPELTTSVRVRMYRHGLGHCTLLSFPRLGRPFYMLIDCGVVLGEGALQAMKTVVKDIHKATEGHLDVVVVTHSHWDCVSGFKQARATFDKIEIDQLWLGWTEDPMDENARRMRETTFFRPLVKGDGSKRRSSSEEAVDYLQGRASRVRYFRGGDGPVALPGVAGVRVFVLGPPKLGADLKAIVARNAAAEESMACPFDDRDQISFSVARENPAFDGYFSADNSGWRRIDKRTDRPPSRVKLDYDSRRNDTSLATAIELSGPRSVSKVLLFPGDAQLQSWLSWHEYRWPTDVGLDDPKAVTCRQLLERTVLYNASHHGSRQGTPRRYGLEMMTSPDLVAMVSIDEAAARRKMWKLPHPGVMAALQHKTHGRILRSDQGIMIPPGGAKASSDARWQEFEKAVTVSALYIDYFVEIPQLTAQEKQSSAKNWTAANERRIYLVDKKLAKVIKPEEEAELRELEQLMDEYLSMTAPTGFGLLAELRQTVEDTKSQRKG
ncbi:hypothetical protein [Prosthecobacter sp.]|uniref:hypothetical protein n=1 Tax=Prosthecobacter sp. TaxID=1965333 RepID=UPI002ABBC1D9|nr:hypothetical protein [Prosthecobacter sp.]MDZ4406264.1 hypothetical protein [Prosthecobacter sp.]